MRERVRNILVVDGDDMGAATVTTILVRAGYEVERTRPGADTIARLSGPDAALPDLLVISIAEPVEAGLALLQALQERQSRRLPVLALTAAATSEQEAEIRRLGANTILSAMASSEMLLAAVGEALRSS